MSFHNFESKDTYKVSAIVSVYKAERFLKACLEDLVAQSIFSETEVIIIDAHSPENERDIAGEFVDKYSNIKYIRTKERETLYASWNRGIKMSQGTYITNANADDRHAPHAFERLSKELDANPQLALVYGDCRITNKVNALFHSAPVTGHFRWLPFDYINLLRRCEIGPQPMWRRKVHDEVGFFDENYVVAGDYDMWLKMAAIYPFRHIPEDLGLYLQHDNNLERQDNALTMQEYFRAQRMGLQYFMQSDFMPSIPFDEQKNTHKHRLLRYICNMENNTHIKNQNKLSFHIFAYILLSFKLRAEQNDLSELSRVITQIPSEIDVNYLKNLLSSV